LFRFALEKGLVISIPPMPKVALQDRPRGWFTRAEYRRLYVTAWVLARRARERGDRGAYDEWMELADFVIFMVSTFLRPSEWASLRHNHVSVVHGPRPHLRIAVTAGKTGERIVCSMPSAVAAYERIEARHGGGEHVFLPDIANRQTAAEKMADRFRKLVAEAGIGSDAFGRSRTMYSLRHSSLMFAVLNGSEPFALAKNAGTSVEQLHRFYLSHLTADMSVAAIHGDHQRKTPKCNQIIM
jgi:integrase